MGDPERGERYRARIALGRLGTMDEIGRTAAFLVSEDSSYITGQVIQVEGGVNMWQGPIG
jgi:NAD(P)-dependent dehydrogenase (short-subunit alcohol dehydrogenase family)